MKSRRNRIVRSWSRARRNKFSRLATLGLERLAAADDALSYAPSQKARSRGLTTLALSSRGPETTDGAADLPPSRRAARHRRSPLTTLSLNGSRPAFPPSLFSTEPQVTETDIWIRRIDAAYDGLRVVHLSDIHHGLYTPLEEVESAVYLANQLRPDLVALTGDYVTFSPGYIWPVARALGALRARLGVFAVLGNHDFQVDPNQITRALQAHGIHVLRNSHRSLRHEALHFGHRVQPLWIVGIDDLWWEADDLRTAVRSISARDAKLLLCHNPLGIYQAAACGIDFVLSGHTHGGQVRLPVVKSLYRSRLGERFVEGWNRLHDTQIYVNRGIGKVLLPVRVDCPPEIACFRLRKAGAQNSNSALQPH